MAATAPFDQEPRKGSYAALAPFMASAEGGARAFQTLSRLAAGSGGMLNAGAVARMTVDHARDLLGADSAAVYWWQPDLEVLGPLADNDTAASSQPPPLNPLEGAAGLAFYGCEPLLVENYPAWDHAVPWMVERGVRSAAATPVVVEGRAVGALVVRSCGSKPFTAQQVETLVLLAAQAGPALEIAQLFFESERRRAEAEGLAELARQCASDPNTDRVVSLVTEKACRLLGADYAGLALTRPDGTRAWRSVWGTRTDAWRNSAQLRGRGPVTRALECRHTVVVEHLGENSEFPLANLPLHAAESGRTTLATPLFTREGALGALVLGWRSDVSLSQRQIRLAEALAGHAATVFESVRGQERLAAQADEVNKLNEDLERRVAERTSELAAANRELEAFSYSVSHDLRAPLRSIDGFTQLLLDQQGERLDDAGKHYLERVRRATSRMGDLIEDLLTLAKVTRRALDRRDVDLSALARSVAQELRASNLTRQVSWEIEDGVEAQADAKLIRVVFENLLGNAWKFTSKHERAVIAFGRCPGSQPPSYFVKDDGSGYDMAYADNLFGPFQRLHSLAEFEGTGVGLATVQRIIHRHGGRIWAESAPEQGATFYFTL